MYQIVVKARLEPDETTTEFKLYIDYSELADLYNEARIKGEEPTKLVIEIGGLSHIYGLPVEYRAKEVP